MSSPQRSWVENWLRLCTRTQQAKTKVGSVVICLCVCAVTETKDTCGTGCCCFVYWRRSKHLKLRNVFLFVPQKQSLSSHFCISQGSLISPRNSRSPSCKSETPLYFEFLLGHTLTSQTDAHLYIPCLFPACKLTTQRTVWRGTSWPRGSSRLLVQGRSSSLPKAGPQMLIEGRSAVARSMRKDSRPLTLVRAHSYTGNEQFMWVPVASRLQASMTCQCNKPSLCLCALRSRAHVELLRRLLLGEGEEED